MKKITRTSLSALKSASTVLTDQQQRAVKGGCSWDGMGVGYWDGGNYYWYRASSCTCSSGNGGTVTQEQFNNWSGDWPGGYVEGWGFVGAESTVTYYPSDYRKVKDGYLCEVSGGTMVYQNNGNSIFLEGVRISTSLVLDRTGYQMNGVIHLAEPEAWTIKEIMHEYGHYLQQNEYGYSTYYVNIAARSGISLLTDPENHSEQWYEKDATERGEAYYKYNVM